MKERRFCVRKIGQETSTDSVDCHGHDERLPAYHIITGFIIRHNVTDISIYEYCDSDEAMMTQPLVHNFC